MKNKLIFKSLTFLALAFFATPSIRASEVTGNLRSSGENSVNATYTPPMATTLDASVDTVRVGNIGSTGASISKPLMVTNQSNLDLRGTALESNYRGQTLGAETGEASSISNSAVLTQETNKSFFDEKPTQTATAFSGFDGFEKNISWLGIILLFIIFLIAITIYIHNRSLRKEKHEASGF